MARNGSGLLVRLMVLLVVGAGLAAGAYYFKASQKKEMGQALLQEFLTQLEGAALDVPSRAYVESLARRFHKDSYERAFVTRDGSTGGTVNVNAYQRALIDRIIAQAGSDGSTHVAAALEKFKAESAHGEGLDISGGGG
jgi:hypothetical protein